MTKKTMRKLKPLPERRAKATSRSSSSDSGSGTDWYSETLTPAHLIPVREYVEIEMGDPVEPETPEQKAESKKVLTPAIHMTLLERYEQETK